MGTKGDVVLSRLKKMWRITAFYSKERGKAACTLVKGPRGKYEQQKFKCFFRLQNCEIIDIRNSNTINGQNFVVFVNNDIN